MADEEVDGHDDRDEVRDHRDDGHSEDHDEGEEDGDGDEDAKKSATEGGSWDDEEHREEGREQEQEHGEMREARQTGENAQDDRDARSFSTAEEDGDDSSTEGGDSRGQSRQEDEEEEQQQHHQQEQQQQQQQAGPEDASDSSSSSNGGESSDDDDKPDPNDAASLDSERSSEIANARGHERPEEGEDEDEVDQARVESESDGESVQVCTAWREDLGHFVEAYLAEGHRCRGSLREAVELISEGQLSEMKSGFAHGLRPGDASDSESNGDDDDEEDDDDDVDEENRTPVSASDSEDDDLPYKGAQFGALEVEKLKRGLTRWRRELKFEESRSLRVSLGVLLECGPLLLDTLEPLAQFWSLQLVHSGSLCDQLLNSWTGELFANALCMYTASLADETKVADRLASAAKFLAGEPERSSRGLCDSLVRLTDLVTSSEQARVDLRASVARLLRDRRMQQAALLAMCKPFARSVQEMEKMNYLVSTANPLAIPLERGISLLEHVSSYCDPVRGRTEMGPEDRTICRVLMEEMTGRHVAVVDHCGRDRLSSRIQRAVALGFGDRDLDTTVSAERAAAQELEDAVRRLEAKFATFRDEMNDVVLATARLVLRAAGDGAP